MNFFRIQSSSPRDQAQNRLMVLAAVFLFLFALVLTLSPAVRLRSWAAPYRWEHWIGFAVWALGFALSGRQVARLLPDRDPYLLPAAALLSGWGLLTVYRLDTVLGLRQTAWLAISLLALWGGLRLPGVLGLLRRYKYVELTGGLLLTALTFLFGTYPGGAGPRLWLGCCGVYLQPSEPLKLLLIVYLAAYLADRLPVSFSLLALITPTLVLSGAALIILVAQRDLGTASLFIFLYSLILYLASGKGRIPLISAAAILAAGVAGCGLFGVIRIRVDAWINPWSDPSGGSYQIVQSLLAVASGGVFGSGPGLGSPSLVPVAHSDFIFAAIAEETGMAGSLALLALIALLAGRGLRAALCATNSYQRYLSAGLSAYLSAQAVLIMAGNLRLAPLTGVTLPFVSYGGSSLLTAFLSLTLLLLISATGEREPAPLPSPRPYLLAGAGLFLSLAALALINGWWSFVRAEDLTARADNPRRFINDRYVQRGAMLDRSNQPINTSEGSPGSYTRRYLYPPLAATAGYTHPVYGLSALEASQDGYLRGLQGNPASQVWTSYLLYNQPPPGLNVRLSLDLKLQAAADQLLGDTNGAVVLINAGSGEILAAASHPYFDPNQLEEKRDEWLADADAPLLNRVTQGRYSPGTAPGPFLLSLALSRGDLPPLPDTLEINYQGQRYTCSAPVPSGPTWEWAVSHGCPNALITLARRLSGSQLADLYTRLGFFQPPAVPLDTAPVSPTTGFDDLNLSALGENGVQVTPLQMALAAAAVSKGGLRPAPRLVMAVQSPLQGWIVLPASDPSTSLPIATVPQAARMLSIEGQPYWQSVATALSKESRITWFLGGTLPDVQGTPLALAVVLEKDDPALAEQIGRALLQVGEQP